ncbi:protein fantom-like isoform X2 [Mizuhopecten yessoensis]|uniref:protein fantom-like isoform X2 n=1 Tax=Mizuhopecten yessoensis TaxID=6573 RepID=UPI000B4579AE|nr:protein fantom-like isoform X2 [Mizuhopecten yessoensis]
MDMIPVRDPGGGKLNHDAVEQKAAQQRRMVSRWDRDSLEDKYLRMYEENLILKKHARKQEDKIKRMATKLLRLVNDKKKTNEVDGGEPRGKKVKDVEMEEKVEELSEKIRSLDKQNLQLKEKLMLSKQQLATNKRTTPYNHVGSRISTGIARTQPQPDSRLAKNMRVTGPMDSPQGRMTGSPTQPRYGHSLLENARADLHHKDDHIAQLQEQMEMYEMEVENMRQQLRLKEAEHEEDLVKIKQQITAEQRVTVQENIDLIRLQREVKEKSTKFFTLQEKYVLLEQNMQTMKHSHDSMLMEMERLNMQVNEEQNRVLTLQNELKFGTTNNSKLIELNEQIMSLEKETQILKEANEKFVNSAFDLDREREWRQRENALKVQIAQLEATLKADLGEKGGILDQLASEKDQHERLQATFRQVQVEHYQQKEEYDDLKQKMKFFTKESAIDFTEIEEALVLVKQRRQQELPEPDFLQKVDNEKDKDVSRSLVILQADYAETIHELEKTRNMLVIQHKINKDYQQEVEIATNRLEEVRKEYEMKLDEYARLLDIRAARIKKLEVQLRDVAYGTKQFKIAPPVDEEDAIADFDETIHLERGQNLFEIHVQKVCLSDEGVKQIGDDEPSVFCTWEFFEFEIQSTPVLKGSRPEFDFTSQYIVKVDDFFLHFLQKDSCTLELHQSFGQDYRTIAACQLVFKEIFNKTHGRIHGTATLTGVDSSGGAGIGFGSVEYWIRLRVPMDQALRLYKERTKALGYVTSNEKAATEALQALDETAAKRPADNVNELHVKILRCSDIKPRRDNVQPSPYCIYQFFDFNDHDTVILASTNNPEYNDHMTYPVPMTKELDHYLKTFQLKVFVFDDTDPEQTAYLGIADVPLIPLAHNKSIQGIFELKGANSKINGTVEMELRWQYTYIMSKGVRIQDPPVMEEVAPPYAPPHQDQSDSDRQSVAESDITPVKQRSRVAAKFPEPSATSTPMPAPPESREGEPAKKIPKRRLHAEPSQEPSLVNDAVKGVISDIMPSSMSDSMTETLPAQPSIHMPDNQTPSREMIVEAPHEDEEEEDEVVEEEIIEEEMIESDEESDTASGVKPPQSLMADVNGEVKGLQKGKKPIPKARKTILTDTKEEILSPKEESKMSDTMFEEEHTEEISEDITEGSPSGTLQFTTEPTPITEESSHESDTPHVMESDSEGVIMAPKPTKRSQKKAAAKKGNFVTITISHLSLEEGANVLHRDNIRQLFVAYNFLGIEPQELETPFSLPKPKPGQQIAFNFSKTFQVDIEKNYTRRQFLASMLLPDDPEQGRIRFTIVSEPPDEDMEGDCEDVGVAWVSIKTILMKRENIIEQDVEVLDVKNEKNVIGSLNLSVDCLAALQAVENEMQVDGTY